MNTSIQKRLMEIDTSDLPSFDDCGTILQKSLWVLWVGKEKIQVKKMNAKEISTILIDVKEVSIRPKNITLSLNKAGDKVHCFRDKQEILYEIMKSGKEYLTSFKTTGRVEVFYFEPGQRYSSKKLLVNRILNSLTGELHIVDPYCGERTFDILKDVGSRPIKFMTRMANINNTQNLKRVLRELKDFRTENPNIVLKDYQLNDLHDRYIISGNSIVLLGHSIKDLGAKESFAIVLSEVNNKNVYEALTENFNRRWKKSVLL